MQEKGEKEADAGGDAGAAPPPTEDFQAKIAQLEAEKAKEEELRNYMQLERVRGSTVRVDFARGALVSTPGGNPRA